MCVQVRVPNLAGPGSFTPELVPPNHTVILGTRTPRRIEGELLDPSRVSKTKFFFRRTKKFSYIRVKLAHFLRGWHPTQAKSRNVYFRHYEIAATGLAAWAIFPIRD